MSDEQMNDSKFGRLFIMMILAMVTLTIACMIIAKFASDGVTEKLDERNDIENSATLAERIAPVGEFSAKTVAAAPVVAKTLSGEQVYTSSCSACHQSDFAGAPAVGNAGAWAPRVAKGIDTLYKNAINGFQGMPPKGGNRALSDTSVKAAVDYMVGESK